MASGHGGAAVINQDRDHRNFSCQGPFNLNPHPVLGIVDPAVACFLVTRVDPIRLRHGDGTLGWADASPFDAILVAAGGPEVPEALRRQLRIGGRLVIPIGEVCAIQELVKVVRDGEDRFHEEDLGPVTFVPLVGAAE
jgi:protein-L-isoaspartate(D-aspartate) O-methyltransferase